MSKNTDFICINLLFNPRFPLFPFLRPLFDVQLFPAASLVLRFSKSTRYLAKDFLMNLLLI